MASRCVPHGPVAALVAASDFVTTFRSETWEISTYDSGVKCRVWVLAIFLVVLGATACSGSDIDVVASATQDLANRLRLRDRSHGAAPGRGAPDRCAPDRCAYCLPGTNGDAADSWAPDGDRTSRVQRRFRHIDRSNLRRQLRELS